MNRRIYGIECKNKKHFEVAKNEVEKSLNLQIGFLFACVESLHRKYGNDDLSKINPYKIVDHLLNENSQQLNKTYYITKENAVTFFLFLSHKAKEEGIEALRFNRKIKKTGLETKFFSLRFDNAKNIICFSSAYELHISLSHQIYLFRSKWKFINYIEGRVHSDVYSFYRHGETLLIENNLKKYCHVDIKKERCLNNQKTMTKKEMKDILKNIEFATSSN